MKIKPTLVGLVKNKAQLSLDLRKPLNVPIPTMKIPQIEY